MKERTLLFLQQLVKLWTSLSLGKRITLITVTLGIVASVLAVSFYSSRETYVFLFTELGADDAASIVAKLKEMKVPYKVEAGGTAIQVTEERVHELRLELAGLGLPRGGGVGFEIFDKTHLGATEFEQRINLRRALEGELSRTISTIGAVQSARVHLVLPERSVFAIGNQASSASVVLKLRPGRLFGKAEVASVVHLVSTAVPGLGPEHVSVVSAEGLMLHRPKAEGGASDLDNKAEGELELQYQLVTRLEERARALLEHVVGVGHADVRVGISLDSTTRERTEEHYEPAKTALRSEQRSEERTSAETNPNQNQATGMPGAATNLPEGNGDAPAAAPAASSGTTKQNWTRNWEIDRVTEKMATPPGRVARLTVAALVDGSYKDGAGGREFVTRERAELDRLGELVKGAVGFQAERGDFLQIECARFATEEPEVARPSTPALPRRYVQYGAYAGAGLLATTLLITLLLARRRARRRAAEAKRLEAEAEATNALEAATASPVLEGAVAEDGTPLLAAPQKDPAEVRAQALEIAVNDPATAAIILRGWLSASTAAPAEVAPARI